MDNTGKRNAFLEKRAAISSDSPARRRIAALLDDGSFLEVGAFVTQRPTEFGSAVQSAAEGVVTGWGTLDGAPVCVFSQDVSALGGAVSEMHAKKIVSLYEYALKAGIPVVGFFDSKGARIKEGMDALDGYAKIIAACAAAAGEIPQIAVVSGLCGGAAAVAASSFDFVITVKGGELYMSSPSVVAAVSGRAEIPAGGAESAICGNSDFYAEIDGEAAALVRELLSFLPANSLDLPCDCDSSDDINRILDPAALGGGSPAEVLAAASDNGAYLECGETFAPEVFTGFARFDGGSVAVVGANDRIGVSGAKKAAAFIAFADAFGLPILTIVNTAGFECAAEFEFGGGLAAAAALAGAYASAGVPMLTLVTGRAVGSAYITLGARGLGADMVFAWPGAQIGALEPGAAVALLDENELQDAAHPVARRAELEREYADKLSSPYEAAKRGYVDEIIDPAETRQALVYALGLL